MSILLSIRSILCWWLWWNIVAIAAVEDKCVALDIKDDEDEFNPVAIPDPAEDGAEVELAVTAELEP